MESSEHHYSGSIVWTLWAWLAISCSAAGTPDGLLTKEFTVPSDTIRAVASRRIFFGHQSVGDNILEGLREIVQGQAEAELRILESDEPEDYRKPVLGHFRIGENTAPRSKIDHFSRLLRSGIGNNCEIAMMKFCYVDINEKTNVTGLFEYYRREMQKLSREYPDVILVHTTVPLTAVQKGPKAFIKRLIGKPVIGVEDNIAKNTFNQMLIETYKGKEPLFDLAALESTLPDGSRSFATNAGIRYYTLADEYTNDGGHLNKNGRRNAAAGLLRFLQSL